MEWKPRWCNVDGAGDTHLETFLGGMETGIVSTILVVRKGLETFLGGMETQHRDADRDVPLDLETFLGGMETVRVP